MMAAAQMHTGPKIASVTGLVPPSDLDAEAAVLCACFCFDAGGADAMPVVSSVLESKHFRSDSNQIIYGVMLDLASDGLRLDAVSVVGELRKRQQAERVGGSTYVAQLLGATPAVANVLQHAEQVLDTFRVRQVIAMAQRIQAEGYGRVPDGWLESASVRIAEASGQTSRTLPWSSAESLLVDEEPIDWVCEPLELAPGPPTVLGGYGGSGKTAAAQSLAVSVASGQPIWGRYGCVQGTVRHLDYEQGRRVTGGRYRRLARAMRVGLTGLPLSFISDHLPSLEDPRTEMVLSRELEGVKLAIVDSLRAGAPSSDENDSAFAAPLRMLQRVSERTDCCIIVVHHARKTSENTDPRQLLRGSSAIYDALQCCWVVQKADASDSVALLDNVKARVTGRSFDQMALGVEDVPDDENADKRWGLRITCEPAESYREEISRKVDDSVEERIVLFVRNNAECSSTEVRDGVKGVRSTTITATMQRLARKGVLKNVGGDGHGKRSAWVVLAVDRGLVS
jgi:hypothetical protein